MKDDETGRTCSTYGGSVMKPEGMKETTVET